MSAERGVRGHLRLVYSKPEPKPLLTPLAQQIADDLDDARESVAWELIHKLMSNVCDDDLIRMIPDGMVSWSDKRAIVDRVRFLIEPVAEDELFDAYQRLGEELEL